jgi:hypothetical protein
MIQMTLFRLLIIVMAIVGTTSLHAQTGVPIPLNRHYFEISPFDSINHQYNKIVSFTSDSIKIERTFTLENKLIRIQRTSPQSPEYQEYSLERFNENGELIEKTTANLFNSKYLTTYFENGKQVGQVIYRGESKYRVYRSGIAETVETLYNDFDPNPIETKKEFGSFISEKVSFTFSEYPKKRHLAVIAVYVNELGEVEEIEWANPLGTAENLADKYLKAVKSWKYGFSPAHDQNGVPVGKWKYFHFHFGRQAQWNESNFPK